MKQGALLLNQLITLLRPSLLKSLDKSFSDVVKKFNFIWPKMLIQCYQAEISILKLTLAIKCSWFMQHAWKSISWLHVWMDTDLSFWVYWLTNLILPLFSKYSKKLWSRILQRRKYCFKMMCSRSMSKLVWSRIVQIQVAPKRGKRAVSPFLGK